MKNLYVPLLGILLGCFIIIAAKGCVPDAESQSVDAKTTLETLTGYDTLEEAAVHAVERAYACSHVYECGGVIAVRESDGKYVVGPVSSSYSGDSVQFRHGSPLGSHVVATYHTHPCHPQSHFDEYFSPEDLMGDITEHLVGIMGELCTGRVHEFDPLSMRPDTDEVQPGTFITQGKIIGQIKVDGASVEPDQGF